MQKTAQRIVAAAELSSAGGGRAAIVVADSARHIVYLNKAAQHLFGAAVLAALDSSCERLIAPRSLAAFRRTTALLSAPSAFAEFIGVDEDLFCLREDGTEFRAEGTITRIEIGKRNAFAIVVRDVTAERQGQRDSEFLNEVGDALGASLDCAITIREFARRCANHFADCCVVTLIDRGNHCAPSALAERDEPTGAIRERDVSPATLRELQPLAEAMASGCASLTQPRIDAPAAPDTDDLRAAVAASSCIAVPIITRGVTAGGILFLSTRERYQLQDLDVAMRAAQWLAAAVDNARLYASATHTLRAHDEMLSFVSHDLRNPLNVIMMAADLLRDRAPETDEFTRHWLDAILQSGERMNALIADLLTTARAEAGGPALHPSPVRAGTLLREALSGHTDAAARKSLILRTELPDEDIEVSVDRNPVVRALSNLIDNAVRLTPEKGSITIRAEGREDEVQFSITDTGPGIPREDMPHIFDRFWQAPGAQRGTGLGLAIVKAVAEAHNGRVRVDSTLGQGTTFYFALPRATPAAESAAAVE